MKLKECVKKFGIFYDVAYEDSQCGIYGAIQLLEDYGFNCDYYWKKLDDVFYVDEYDLNTKTRDELYKLLGIYEIMQVAYEFAWNPNFLLDDKIIKKIKKMKPKSYENLSFLINKLVNDYYFKNNKRVFKKKIRIKKCR